MFYVIADAERVRPPADPRRGRRHRPHHRDDQGGGGRAAARSSTPTSPASPGITIGQLSGPAHDPANSRRNAVTVSTGTLDWERPSTWTGAIDRSPCGTGTSAQDGRRSTPGAARGRRRVPPRGRSSARSSRGRVVEETTIGDVPGDRPEHHRPGLDHRLCRPTSSTRPTRSPTATPSATSGREVRQAGSGLGSRTDGAVTSRPDAVAASEDAACA